MKVQAKPKLIINRNKDTNPGNEGATPHPTVCSNSKPRLPSSYIPFNANIHQTKQYRISRLFVYGINRGHLSPKKCVISLLCA